MSEGVKTETALEAASRAAREKKEQRRAEIRESWRAERLAGNKCPHCGKDVRV